MDFTDEQDSVLKSKVKDLVVSASAGSGKTFIVIEKIIRLICDDKVPVERLLVLTFTKAASQEMQNRLYKAILEKPSSDFLIEQIDALPLSDISTIDSFCEKIIKRNINKLDIDENFVILDEKTSKNLKKLAFSRTFQFFSQNKVDDFEQIYFAFKRNKDNIEDCVFALQDFLASCNNQEDLLEKFEEESEEYNKLAETELIKNIKESFKQASDVLSFIDVSSLNKVEDKIYNHLKNITTQDFDKDIFTLSQNINSFLPLPAFRGKMEEENKNILSKARDYIKEGLKITENYLYVPQDIENSIKEGTLIKALVAFYRHFIFLYNSLKAKRDGLDFADIEYYAKQLLEDPDIKKSLQDKYDYIFIDEYQDTNRLQQSILKPISEGGYFVAVGDLKQGIYGFRNARMEIMQEDIENFLKKPDGDALRLTGNFRTDKNVLDFVNVVFNKVMTLQSVGIDYENTSNLVGLQTFKEDSLPAIAVDIITKREKTKEEKEQEKENLPTLYSVQEAELGDESLINEILAIQERIEQVYDSEIYDAKKKVFRKVNYSDITLLFRNRSSLMRETYKHLVKQGFPVNADIKESLLDDGEVGVIYSLLKLTLNMHDDISLVAVMNSFFGNFNIDELAEYRLSENRKGSKKKFFEIFEESVDEKILKLKEKINNFKFEIQIFGIIKALNRLFNDHDYYSYLQSLDDGYEKIGNINALFKLIRSANLDNNVCGVINQLEGVQESAGGGGGNAITMTTIHATKGLEYPIVILCGAGESLTKPWTKSYIISEKFGLASYINDFENMLRVPSPNFIAGKLEKHHREFIDEIMIFYVAMTRAQNHLFIIGSGKEKDLDFENINNQNSYLKMIFYALGENLTSQIFSQGKVVQNKWEFNVFDEIEFQPEETNDCQQKEVNFQKEIEEYNNFKYPFKDISKLSFKNSVTGAMKLNEQEELITPADNLQLSNNQLAIDRGNAYHEALKLLDFDKINSLEDLKIEIEKIKDFMTEGYIQLIDEQLLLKNILIIKELTSGGQLCKEKEFIMQCSLNEIGFSQSEEKVIIQGIVDLFAVGEELTLVDYKFSSLSSDALKARYGKQIQLYSQALEKAFNKKIEKRYLLSLKNGEVIKL